MPRPRKPARLYLRKRQGRDPRWVIRDGDTEIDTGCGMADEEGAAIVLGNYLRLREAPAVVDRERAYLSAVLEAYARGHAATTAAPKRIAFAIDRLLPFWGGLEQKDITRTRVREYMEARGVSAGTIRRELGVLSAALHWCEREGLIDAARRVPRPDAAEPKSDWLTRSEVATMLWASRRFPHIVRLILLGIYTGTRIGAMTALRWQPHEEGGWIDTRHMVLYRIGQTQRRTNKRRPPAPLPRQLQTFVRYWREADGWDGWVIAYRGSRVTRPNKAWDHACRAIGRNVTFHVLRHTAITWAMQNGAPVNEVSGYFGVTQKVLEDVYWHHHPDFLRGAREAIERRRT